MRDRNMARNLGVILEKYEGNIRERNMRESLKNYGGNIREGLKGIWRDM